MIDAKDETQGCETERPSCVVFGGGSGLNTLLTGLKAYTDTITAVVTVTDDGGSSGRIRAEFNMLPPGDIRNCLLALAEAEPLMLKLFDYRFEESDLEGHNFGNLLITALTKITGSFLKAIETANKILAVRGRVLPSTLRKVSLVAHHPDGSKSTGEVSIVESGKPIEKIVLRPDPGRVRTDIADDIANADILVFGPGSLFTSIIPNLLLDGLPDCVLANQGVKIFVCNIMTQPGETDGMDLQAHVDKFLQHAGCDCLTHVVVNSKGIDAEMQQSYHEGGSVPVVVGDAKFDGVQVVVADVLNQQDAIRHNPEKLSECIYNIYKTHKG